MHLRILHEVATVGSKGLTYKELIRIYNLQVILKKRLVWLVNCGEIGMRGRKFYRRRRHSILVLRENFFVLLSKLYGKDEEFSIVLPVILLGALIVRLWGINFGLPYTYFVDEGYLVYSAFYLGGNLLKPVYYLYAPLVPTLLLFEYAVYYGIGHIAGVFSTPLQFFISYLSDAFMFFLIGRITMVIVGVAAVWLVNAIGKTFFNARIGLLASFFLAFTFLHVKESHYIKQDILLGFFVLAVFYFALKIFRKGSMKDYLLGGLMFGLAMGTKYQSILMLPVIVLSHALSAGKILSWKLILLGGISLITFLIIHPYFILETIVTLSKTLANAEGTFVFYTEHLQGRPVWWWYMFEHIPQGIGYPLFISSIIGFAVSFWRAKSKKSYLFIPLLPILFFVTIDFFTKMHFARYAVITLPFFALSGAIFLDFAVGIIKNEKIHKILLVVLAALLIAPSFLRTVKFDSLLTKADTRTMAKEWFEDTIDASSKVLVESMAKPEHPSNLNLTLTLDQKSIDERISQARERGLEALYLKSLKIANKDKIGYDIIATTQVAAKVDIFTDELTYLKNIDFYVNSGVEYIVLTSWVQEKMKPEFEKSLHQNYQLIKEFRPTYEFTTDPHLIKVDYANLDRVDIFRKGVVFGPVIRIYKLKDDK